MTSATSANLCESGLAWYTFGMTKTQIRGSELQIGDKFIYAGCLTAEVIGFGKEFKTTRHATIRHEEGTVGITVRHNSNVEVQR